MNQVSLVFYFMFQCERGRAVEKVTERQERSFSSFVFCLQSSLKAVAGQWQNTHSAQDDILIFFFNNSSLMP
jgi:hypothetical protein